MKKTVFIAILAFAFTHLAASDKSAAPVHAIAAASNNENNSPSKNLSDYLDPKHVPAHMQRFINKNLSVLEQDTEDDESDSDDSNDPEILELTRTSLSRAIPIPSSPRNPSPLAHRNEQFLRSLQLAMRIQKRLSPIQS